MEYAALARHVRLLRSARAHLDQAIEEAMKELRAMEERDGHASVHPDPDPPADAHASGFRHRFDLPAEVVKK